MELLTLSQLTKQIQTRQSLTVQCHSHSPYWSSQSTKQLCKMSQKQSRKLMTKNCLENGQMVKLKTSIKNSKTMHIFSTKYSTTNSNYCFSSKVNSSSSSKPLSVKRSNSQTRRCFRSLRFRHSLSNLRLSKWLNSTSSPNHSINNCSKSCNNSNSYKSRMLSIRLLIRTEQLLRLKLRITTIMQGKNLYLKPIRNQTRLKLVRYSHQAPHRSPPIPQRCQLKLLEIDYHPQIKPWVRTKLQINQLMKYQMLSQLLHQK